MMGFFKNLLERLEKRADPVGYWRKRGARIGEGCEIYAAADLGSEPYLIRLGDRVRVTGGVRLITHDGGVWVLRHLYEELRDADLFGPIVIGDNVHIGMNAVVMPGVTVGSNCIIGCGAIVTRDVPDNSVVAGVPARVIRTLDGYLDKNGSRIDHTKGMTPGEKKAYLCGKYGIE